MKKFNIAFSSGPIEERTVEAKSVDDAIDLISADFKRGMVVGVSGPRGGAAKFFMKRDDGDTVWPISARTAATFASLG